MDNVTKLPTVRKQKLPTIPPPTDPISRENFFHRGLTFIREKCEPDNLPIVRLGTPECEAWARYFRAHLGWEPWMLTALERGEIESMTLPTQYPEWFDTNYAGMA